MTHGRGSGAMAITGATALLGESLTSLDDAVVVIEGEDISRCGPATEVAVPDTAEIVDARGHLLTPGFIDAHVHIAFADPLDVVRGGVTSARDLASPPHGIWPLVARSAGRHFAGPTLIAAGQMLTAPGGYPLRAAWAPEDTGLAVEGPSHAEAAVEAQARAGAAVVKVALNPEAGPVLDEETLAAIVDASHRRGLKVTGHTSGLEQLDKALTAGMDELAHMLMGRAAIPDRTIRRMVEADMAVVPTLSCFFGKERATGIDNLRRFALAGGRVVYGTDLGNKGPQPGIDAREVHAMAEAGLSPLAIVRAATVDSAPWLGLRRTGAIHAGYRADIVAVDRSALEDPAGLTRVSKVWRRGVRVR